MAPQLVPALVLLSLLAGATFEQYPQNCQTSNPRVEQFAKAIERGKRMTDVMSRAGGPGIWNRKPDGLSDVPQQPRFTDYPAEKIFRGTPNPPVLNSKLARAFRTQLREQAASGPNFAGHYTIARWGCGAGCVTIAVIDATNGAVEFAPFSIEAAWKDGEIVCGHGSDFELASELFIASGEVNGKVGTHYFRWRNRRFSLLHVGACSM